MGLPLNELMLQCPASALSGHIELPAVGIADWLAAEDGSPRGAADCLQWHASRSFRAYHEAEDADVSTTFSDALRPRSSHSCF